MKENKIKQPAQIEVRRSEIKFANYNPRKISESARKKLKANLKRIGLLGGIIWNRTTGNLVSGHQRVSIMDEVNKYNDGENDYTLRVEVVEMDEKTEKEQNLFMNNRSVQGEFDSDMLKSMLVDIDYSLAGLEDFDLQLLGIGDVDFNVSDIQWVEEEAIEETGFVEKSSEEDRTIDRSVDFYDDTPENQIKRHNDVQNIKDRIQNERKDDGGMLSYVVLSFKNPESRIRFMEMMGYGVDDKYLDGEEFSRKIEFGEL